MKGKRLQILCIALLVLLVPVSSFAISLNDAAKNAARQHDAKVLSARTIQQGNKRTHEIKLLTKKGVVKIVRVPDNKNNKKR